MVSFETLHQLALSYEGATEQPHFEKTSFRANKKIFATYDAKKQLACLKLSEVDQDVYSTLGKVAIYAVPNKWGKQGWTLFDLNIVSKELLADALDEAYGLVVGKK
ncbi:MAG: MmcQ/YjbR family DNA-binding protein [Bacteroidetes bacterium]|nr:MmcQ/YjbR family DNA-binding protein [Bacteroidota bacterium]